MRLVSFYHFGRIWPSFVLWLATQCGVCVASG
ncbi:hypothetical protein FHY10_002621 [Xanthomonas arboricola]|nr:hypothetical protein [Xanthomonas arboricola]